MSAITLLQLTRELLASLGIDPDISHIYQTEDSERVVSIIRDSYDDIISELDLSKKGKLFRLEAVDPDKPTILRCPDQLHQIQSIKYGVQPIKTADPLPFVYITSRPYPVEDIEYITSIGLLRQAPDVFEFETVQSSGYLFAGTLHQLLSAYTNWPAEAVSISGSLISGTLHQTLLAYTFWPAEAMSVAGSLRDGTLRVALITYTNWPTEAVSVRGSLIDGTLV